MRTPPVILAILLTGCSADRDLEPIRIGDASYSVPASHIRARTTKPHLFVRVKVPDSRFDLVFDSRSTRRTDAYGWPVIFSLNDGTAPNVDRYDRRGLKIVCRRAVNPEGGCGSVVVHRGVEWSVLYPIGQFAAARRIEQAARTALEGYDTERT